MKIAARVSGAVTGCGIGNEFASDMFICSDSTVDRLDSSPASLLGFRILQGLFSFGSSTLDKRMGLFQSGCVNSSKSICDRCANDSPIH